MSRPGSSNLLSKELKLLASTVWGSVEDPHGAAIVPHCQAFGTSPRTSVARPDGPPRVGEQHCSLPVGAFAVTLATSTCVALALLVTS